MRAILGQLVEDFAGFFFFFYAFDCLLALYIGLLFHDHLMISRIGDLFHLHAMCWLYPDFAVATAVHLTRVWTILNSFQIAGLILAQSDSAAYTWYIRAGLSHWSLYTLIAKASKNSTVWMLSAEAHEWLHLHCHQGWLVGTLGGGSSAGDLGHAAGGCSAAGSRWVQEIAGLGDRCRNHWITINMMKVQLPWLLADSLIIRNRFGEAANIVSWRSKRHSLTITQALEIPSSLRPRWGWHLWTENLLLLARSNVIFSRGIAAIARNSFRHSLKDIECLIITPYSNSRSILRNTSGFFQTW